MSYKSILLNVGIDGPIAPVTKIAIDLARRSKARLIGFCAADAPLPVTMAPEGAAIAAEVWQQLRDDIKKRFEDLHVEFDSLVAGSVATEWRNTLDIPNQKMVPRRAGDYLTSATLRNHRSAGVMRMIAPESFTPVERLRTDSPK